MFKINQSLQIVKKSFELAIKTPALLVLSAALIFAILVLSFLPFLIIEIFQIDTFLIGLVSGLIATFLSYALTALIVAKIKALYEKKNYSYFNVLVSTAKPLLVLSLISLVVQLPALFLSTPTGLTDPQTLLGPQSMPAEIDAAPIYTYPATSLVALFLANLIMFVWAIFSMFSIPIIVNGNKNVLNALRQSVTLLKKTFAVVIVSTSIITLAVFMPSILFGVLAIALWLFGVLNALLLNSAFFVLFVLVVLSIPISIVLTLVLCSIALQLIYANHTKNNSDKLDLIIDERSLTQEHNAAWYFATFMFLGLLIIISLQAAQIVKIEPDWLLYVLVILGLGVFTLAYKRG